MIIRDQVSRHLAEAVPGLAAASNALYELVGQQVSGKDPELVDFKLEVKVEDADGKVTTHEIYVELKSTTAPLPLTVPEPTPEVTPVDSTNVVPATPPTLSTATVLEKSPEVLSQRLRGPSEVEIAERILTWFRQHPEQTVTISKMQDELNRGAELADMITSDTMRISWRMAVRQDHRLQQVSRKSWTYLSQDSDFETPPEDEELTSSDPVAPQTATPVAG